MVFPTKITSLQGLTILVTVSGNGIWEGQTASSLENKTVLAVGKHQYTFHILIVYIGWKCYCGFRPIKNPLIWDSCMIN